MSVSTAELREIISLLREIKGLMQETSEATQKAKFGLSEFNQLLTTYVALARRVGIEGNIMDAIARFQQLRIAAEAAYRAVILLYSSTTLLGGAVAIGGLFIAGFMLIDQMEMLRPRY